ncbi:hypothetical protein FI632_22060 [Salmonella enterica subsp. enterica]|nr:hypothetical protein [Salmonella enterica subsp. enterica]
MAERHFIDLPPRSQDLSSAFLHYCMNYGEPWFIKDENGCYLLHSRTISDVLGCEKDDLVGYTDNDLCLLSTSYRKNQDRINKLSVKDNSKIVSLEIHRYSKLPVFSPYLYVTTPFLYRGKTYTHSRLVDICMLRTYSFLSHSSLFECKNSTDSMLEFPVSSFSQINPVTLLNDSQWEVLWLYLMGFSYRKVSNITGRTLKNTVEYISRALKTLNLHTVNNFLYVSKLYGWERYIPVNIQNRSLSEIVGYEKIS